MYNTFKKYCESPQGSPILEKWNYLVPEDKVNCPVCRSDKTSFLYKLGGADALSCKKCGLKYISPRLSEKQIEEYYSKIYSESMFTKDFEGREHDMFDDSEERRRKIKDRYVEIERTNKFIENGRILDVGSGTGLYFEGLKGNKELFGIELSPKAAEYTRKKFNAEILEYDITEVNFDKESFDVVNMTYIIEHLYNPAEVMKKVLSWLKPGGMLLVSSPNWDSAMSRIYKEFFRLNDPCQHINLWGHKSLPLFVESFGCKLGKVYYPYYKTEYFNCYEVMRLFRNTCCVKILPFLMSLGCYPQPDKVLSPPFRGNIMVVEAYKE